jgi:hypothetical protein
MNEAQLDKELIRLAGLASEEARSEETCWVDRSKCPYGPTGGQFLLRPRQFCHPGKFGCRKITDNINDLNEMAAELQREGIEKELSELINKSALSLSGEVGAVADCVRDEKDEKREGILRLAAAIIKEMEEAKDPNIVKILRFLGWMIQSTPLRKNLELKY